jgi:heme-degrading monooxygenase HmoA
MNRFKVLKDRTSDFESTWLNREIHLPKLPGFISFHLLGAGDSKPTTLSHPEFEGFSVIQEVLANVP